MHALRILESLLSHDMQSMNEWAGLARTRPGGAQQLSSRCGGT